MQVPQFEQRLTFTAKDLVFIKYIASLGQISIHFPHFLHNSRSILANKRIILLSEIFII